LQPDLHIVDDPAATVGELLAEQFVDSCDLGLDHGQRVAADRHSFVEDLMHELADEIFCARLLAVVARHLAFGDDRIEQ